MYICIYIYFFNENLLEAGEKTTYIKWQVYQKSVLK